MARKAKVPTYTSLVLEYLRNRDDMVPRREIVAVLTEGLPPPEKKKAKHAVFIALAWLQQCKAVESIKVATEDWWFALPPEYDTRTKTVAERTPEEKPRRRRRGRGDVFYPFVGRRE